ncbi:amino acid adenylation [Basidiobolus meristosporus CBS 931.73]|uniref:Amino acid adenylation n=1 Tax=Basidiobolus meristosporus CBS 931.73 TaxID=1314790 RepID=A0A1Y1Y5A7_9FUNG|nr:amino acid adenylation [Basidiobolus meristosporus CBS 931.73]|eukprot:ORX93211.1 amino acid adenylation [Basidiobolus meristosporus CBS 931.73]
MSETIISNVTFYYQRPGCSDPQRIAEVEEPFDVERLVAVFAVLGSRYKAVAEDEQVVLATLEGRPAATSLLLPCRETPSANLDAVQEIISPAFREIASEERLLFGLWWGSHIEEYPLEQDNRWGIRFIKEDGHCSIILGSELIESEELAKVLVSHSGILLIGEAFFFEESLISLYRFELPDGDLLWKKNVRKRQFVDNNLLLHELFEKSARCCRRNIAVRFGESAYLTYDELNRDSEKLTLQLRQLGVGPGTVVAVCMERSLEMIVAVIAVLKAGAAYVPLDPYNPPDRLKFMILDSGANRVILTQRSLKRNFEEFVDHVLCLDAWEDTDFPAIPMVTPRASLDDLAYIIYTSGSTGTPKGVMISHLSAVNTILDMNETFRVSSTDSVLAVASLSFDLSVYDIFGLLACGGTIVIPEPVANGAPSPEQWLRLMKLHNVTIWNSAPPVMTLMVDYLLEYSEILHRSLRWVFLSGDWIPLRLQGTIKEMVPECQLISLGGATEASIWSIFFPVDKIEPSWKSIPYGRPMTNQTFYIVNDELDHVPLGAPGELCIGGVGVALGYYNRDEINKKKFVPNPFAPGRLYRTGDLGRMRPDGNIEFLGRMDTQVKIRGHRVELGEIETLINGSENVRDNLVILHNNNLAAFLIPEEVNIPPIRAALSAALPAYMVPSQFIPLSSFPITLNGKIDRKALVNILEQRSKELQKPNIPTTSVQSKLCELYAATLNYCPNSVGIHDSFFELGGDSISVMRLTFLCRKAGLEVTAQQVFTNPTILKLSSVVNMAQKAVEHTFDQGAVTGTVPLTPIQQWFFELELINRNHWNQSFLIRPRENVQYQSLKDAINTVVRHHDMLRCRFTEMDTRWVQKIFPIEEEIPLLYEKVEGGQLQESILRLQSSLNISDGPIIAGALWEIGDEQRILIVIHHLVVDLVSWRVLWEDLQAAMEGKCLPSKATSFKKWSESLFLRAQDIDPRSLLIPYQHEPLLINPPTDEVLMGNPMRSASFALDPTYTKYLQSHVHDAYRTNVPEILLSALLLSYHQATGGLSLKLDMEGHGREPWDDSMDVSRCIGWFTTMFPVFLRMEKSDSMGAAIMRVKETLRSIPHKGLSHSLLKYSKVNGVSEEENDLVRAIQNHPPSEILFNYYGRFDQFESSASMWDLAPEYDNGRDDFAEGERWTHGIVIEGFIIKNQLKVVCKYDSSRYDTILLEAWVSRTEAVLSKLITHCLSPEVGGFTKSDLSLVKLSSYGLDELNTFLSTKSKQIEDIYPCTPMQQGLLSSLARDKSSYLVQVALSIHGDLDQDRFRHAWVQTAENNSALRTFFAVDLSHSEACQLVYRLPTLNWTMGSWEIDYWQELEAKFLQQDRARGFDVSEPMTRYALFSVSKEHHRFVWTVHHSILDGWSIPLVLRDVVRAYLGHSLNAAPRFRSYIEYLLQNPNESAAVFWKEKLNGVVPCNLQGFPEPNASKQGLRKYDFQCPIQFSDLVAFGRANGLTISTILKAAWAIVLAYYTNELDVVFGVVMSGRSIAIDGIDKMTGMLVNTLPLRLKLRTDMEILTWLQDVQDEQAKMVQYECCSLAQIQQWASCGNHSNLFSTILGFENYPELEIVEESSIQINGQEVHEVTEYSLALNITPMDSSRLLAKFLYDSSAMDEALIKNLAKHFGTVLLALTTTTTERLQLSDIQFNTREEEIHLVHTVSSNKASFPEQASIHGLFEEWARVSPSSTALQQGGAELTYQELNEKSDALAWHLCRMGFQSSPVGLYISKSIDMIVGIFGILKSGATYVPIDAALPISRVNYMLNAAKCQSVVTTSRLSGALSESLDPSQRIVPMDRIHGEQHHQLPKVGSTQLAYIIFTSGTTGKPKGVMVEHRGLVNLTLQAPNLFSIGPGSKVMQFYAVSFDGCAWEIFNTLCNGGTLIIPEQDDIYTAMTLADTLFITPSILATMHTKDYPLLKRVIVGGEPCPSNIIKAWSNSVELINAYGPTEITVCSNVGRLSTDERTHVGRPVANVECYILDCFMKPCPVGVVGNLYIGGVGVSRGYVNNHSLTQENFLANPFGPGKIYNTGDLARWSFKEKLEIIGRQDTQVKIHGYRIELEEIESNLCGLPGIQSAAVIVHEEKLLAFVTPESILEANVKKKLRQLLPIYMVPNRVIPKSSLPVTENGKLDRRGLSAYTQTKSDGGSKSKRLATNHVEETILAAFAIVLGKYPEEIGSDDSFFELGGDSISAMRLISILKRGGLLVNAHEVFENPSSDELAKVAKQNNPKSNLPIYSSEVIKETSLTPIQFWFLEECKIRNKHHFNQSFLLRLRSPLKVDQIHNALNMLVAHHDALRSRFRKNGSHWVQFVPAAGEEVVFHQSLVRSLAEMEQEILAMQTSLNIETGPMIAGCLFDLEFGMDGGSSGDEHHGQRLFLTIHHLVVDLVSWRIILEDLQSLIEGEQLPPKTMPFQQWAMILRNYGSSLDISIWPVKPTMHLPQLEIMDVAVEDLDSSISQKLSVTLDAQMTKDLLEIANQAYRTTPMDLLLAGFITSYMHTFNEDSISVDLEGHGREPWDPMIDIHRTVGWFTSVYPFFIQLGSSRLIADTIIQVKEALRAIPQKGFPYGVITYCKEKNRSNKPVDRSDISFNYFGRFDQLESANSLWDYQFNFDSKTNDVGIEEKPLYPVTAEAVVSKNSLLLSIEFDSSIAQRCYVEQWADAWKESLVEIVKHCRDSRNGHPTKSDLPLLSMSQPQITALINSLDRNGFSGRDIEDLYPCTPLQSGLLMKTIDDPSAYMVQSATTVIGELDPMRFQQAWQQVVNHQAILRTTFLVGSAPQDVQLVRRAVSYSWTWGSCSEDELARLELDYIKQDRHRGFKVTENLMRFALFKFSANKNRFIWTFHHALLDGWSVSLVLRSVMDAYYGLKQRPEIKFRRFVENYSDSQSSEAQNFWCNYLKEARPCIIPKLIQTTYRKSDISDPAEGAFTRKIPGIYDIVEAKAHAAGCTISTITRAAWALLLRCYTGQDDIQFGVTVSGRNSDIEGIENVVGLCINTIPFRVHFDPSLCILDWLRKLHSLHAAILPHEHYSLAKILSLAEGAARGGLFNSIFVYENYPPLQHDERCLAIRDNQSYENTEYPLSLAVERSTNDLILTFMYNNELYDQGSIARISHHFETALHSLATMNLSESIARISVMAAEEENLVSSFSNPTVTAEHIVSTTESCFLGLFKHQVHSIPENIAVQHKDSSLTYQQLCRYATLVAGCLLQVGLKLETPVALLTDRSMGMIIGILGIQMAGGAYVPIDCTLPQSRIEYMLKDSGCTLMINVSTERTFSPSGVQTIQLSNLIQATATDVSLPAVNGENLAYIVYTSGTTGNPKGVMVEHGGLYNFAKANVAGVTPGKKVLQFFSVGFDGCAMEIFMTLGNGGCLILSNEDSIFDSISQVEVMMATPSMLSNLDPSEYPAVNTVVAGGEKCHPALVAKWEKHAVFLNAYGPTEATICTNIQRLTSEDPISVGPPLPNVQCYILDSDSRPVPIGIVGELYIGGIGVARGYVGREELTIAKFIKNPFAEGRLYVTGDRARWLTSGAVEILGRMDSQVKIRGYRIEIEEIVSTMNSHDGVNEATVVARDAQLIGLISPNDVDIESIYSHLRDTLPSYMVPYHIYTCDTLPRTTNGKIDLQQVLEDTKKMQAVEIKNNPIIQPASELQGLVLSAFEDVLSQTKLSMLSDFFDFGGCSLSAMRLRNSIQVLFDVRISMSDVFRYSTALEMSGLISKLKSTGVDRKFIISRTPLTRMQDVSSECVTSFAQEQMILLYELDPSSPVYNVPVGLKIRGNLDVGTLTGALRSLIQKHTSLRTYFAWMNDQTYQKIVLEDRFELNLNIVDISSLQSSEKANQLDKQFAKHVNEPFDLYQPPLYRLLLIKWAEDIYYFLFNMHHAITDGRSCAILLRELFDNYTAMQKGIPIEICPDMAQYADFAYWQRQWLSEDIQNSQIKYWKQKLQNAPTFTTLPLDLPRPQYQTFCGTSYTFDLNQEVAERMVTYSQKANVTVFTFFLTVFKVLLHRYTDSDDLVVGTVTSGRNQHDVQNIVGYFVNTLALRTYVSSDHTFEEYLYQVKETLLEAMENVDLPFQHMVSELSPERDPSYHPLFQTMILLQENPIGSVDVPGLDISLYDTDLTSAKFDFVLELARNSVGGYSGTITYSVDIFDQCRIHDFAQHFASLVATLADSPKTPVRYVEYMSANEKRRILEEFNETDRPISQEGIHQIFEQHALLYPNNIAVEHGATNLRYLELNRNANAVAMQLKMMGVNPGDNIALFTNREVTMIIGIIGILKAGGVYVPIDATLPKARVKFMIQDSNCKLVLTSENLLHQYHDYISNRPNLCFEQVDQHSIGQTSCSMTKTQHKDAAYIIYTSGTTGKPKGCMVSHRGLCNLVTSNFIQICPKMKVMQFFSIGFDGCAFEIFMTLCNGGTLVLRDEDFGATLLGVDTIAITPSVLLTLSPAQYPNLKSIIVAGEPCPKSIVASWASTVKLYNAYGPTEATICTNIKLLDYDTQHVTVGKPIANVKCYILDRHMQPVANGVIGELYLGGVGIAIGYVGLPELTGSRFIPNPFGYGRLYKTGDLAKWTRDGEVDLIGRIDNQVKLRGYRIELSEIESALAEYHGVEATAVMLHHKKLFAFVRPECVESQGLQEYLLRVLPSYMIPSQILKLPKFPRTSNDKIDYQALSEIISSVQLATKEVITATNAVQEIITRAFSAALGLPLESISIYDSFFQLGGDSITAMQVVSFARKKSISIKVQNIFQTPTIIELSCQAQWLTASSGNSYDTPFVGVSSLIPIQLWFLEECKIRNKHHFNQSFLLRLRSPLKVDQIHNALNMLVAHHDALRSRFSKNGSHWVQFVPAAGEEVVFHQSLVRSLAEMEQEILAMQTSLNIETGPMIAGCLFDLEFGMDGGSSGDEHHGQRLFLTIHHLVVDLVSWRIILEDLQSLIEGEQLPPKTMPFQQWALNLYKYAPLIDSPWPQSTQIFSLVSDPYAQEQLPTIEFCSIDLEPNLTAKLLHASMVANIKIQEVLITTLLLSYHRLSGEKSLTLHMEGHGREPWDNNVDISRTVGWFTSIYPVSFILDTPDNIPASIIHVKEVLRSIPQNGFIFGLLQSCLPADTITKSYPDIAFNYHGKLWQTSSNDSLWELQLNSPLKNSDIAQNEHLTHKITADCTMYDEQATLRFGYDTSFYSRRTVMRWMKLWKAAVLEVLEYCQSRGISLRSPSDFPLLNISQKQLEDVITVYLPQYGLDANDIEDMYPCTPLQSGLLMQLIDDPSSYLVQSMITLEGTLDLELFKDSWKKTAQHYDILRTVFLIGVYDNDLQIVRKSFEPNCLLMDCPDIGADQFVMSFVQNDRKRGFEPVELLMRLTVFQFSPTHHQLLWTVHHSLLDGWSIPLVLNTLMDFYRGETPLPTTRFRDFVQYNEAQDHVATRAFWESYLEGVNSTFIPSSLAIDTKRKCNGQSIHGIKGVFDSLESLARNCRVTISTLIRAAWAIVLSHCTNQLDVVFGVTVSGRAGELMGVESIVGLLINTVPFRVQVNGSSSLAPWLKQLHDSQTSMLPHEYRALTDNISTSRTSPYGGLFNTIIVYENYPSYVSNASLACHEELRLTSAGGFEFTEYPMAISFAKDGEDLAFKILYNESFGEDDVSLFSHYIENVILGMVSHAPSGSISDLSIVSSSERKTLLHDFNPPNTCNAEELTILDLFNAQVKANPNGVGVEQGNCSLTYSELYQQVEQLQYTLGSLLQTPNPAIGLLTVRSPEMIVGALGILKAGGAYVPIDASLPLGRITHMIDTSGCPIIVTTKKIHGDFVELLKAKTVVHIDDLIESAEPVTCMDINSDSLAYIIFTSGSTGMPKGVMVEHRGLYNVIMANIANVQRGARVMQFFSIGFDGCVIEIFTTLCHGGTLVLCDNDDFTSTISMVDTLLITPSVLNDLKPGDFHNLKTVLVAGESCSGRIASTWAGHVNFVNAYGPTEATVCSNFTTLHAGDKINVGKPIQNMKCYILDDYQRLLPIGAKGELYLGGVGIARGYIGSEELNRKSFLHNPFEYGRLYRTGDKARWLPDGMLEILGRSDNQLKIRGYRVELDEVRLAFEKCNLLHQSSVVVVEDALVEMKLVAFVTPKAVDLTAVKSYLAKVLPAYMIPNHIYSLDMLPLTTNQKVDDNELKKHAISLSLLTEAKRSKIYPVTALERKILCAFMEALSLPKTMDLSMMITSLS